MPTSQQPDIHKLKMNFLNAPSHDAIADLLIALKDSALFLPVSIQMDKHDQEKFLQGQKGDIVQTEHDMQMKPDILQDKDGKLFLPVFSNIEQFPKDYGQKFSKIQFPTIRCVQMAHALPNLSGLILDAFTEPLPLSFDIADMFLTIPLESQD